MTRLVRSARGVSVDFDLIRIKEQIASAPQPTTVASREAFVDSKLKRHVRRAVQQQTQLDVPQPTTAQPDIDPITE